MHTNIHTQCVFHPYFGYFEFLHLLCFSSAPVSVQYPTSTDQRRLLHTTVHSILRLARLASVINKKTSPKVTGNGQQPNMEVKTLRAFRPRLR